MANGFYQGAVHKDIGLEWGAAFSVDDDGVSEERHARPVQPRPISWPRGFGCFRVSSWRLGLP